jgi:transposase
LLGPSKPRRLDQPIAVSLEALIPEDNFYRHLEANFDLSFVREWVSDLYAERGRPSVDPVVYFKLQLIMFFEGIRSERQLMQLVADRLSLGWYLGYDLPESLPDHSSLTRIRERYGLEIFRRFFEAVVAQCIAAGLVWGRELYIDATKVAANADLDSLHPRFAVEAHLTQFFAAEQDNEDGSGRSDSLEGGGDEPARLPVALTDEAQAALAERAATRHDWIRNAGHPNRTATSDAYRRTADFRISTTDPDATPMPPGDGGTHLGYQDHYVVAFSPNASGRAAASTKHQLRPAWPACSGVSAPRPSRGRRVGRSLDADYLDRVRAYQETEPFAKAMRKRQVWVEPLFAEAKAWHGLRRFRLRGLEKVNGEALLIAAGQNLKRILSR